jgi:hypothetical protein
MAYDTLRFRITGVSPLVMHNGRMADPTSAFSRDIRKISGKRKKTEADFFEIARLELLGSLYLTRGEPCLPGEVLEACVVRGAVNQKRGKAAKAGILCLGSFPLEYEGPRDPLQLWEQEKFRLVAGVKLGNSRVMRTRPVFPQWAVEIEVKYNPLAVNADEVENFLVIAGEFEGIGDWRPRFGRFSVQRL